MFLPLAEQGDADAQFNLGIMYDNGNDAYNRKDYKTAYKLWLPLAEQGDAKAQFMMGSMYYVGQGVPKDYKKAVEYYSTAIKQDPKNPLYLNNLAEAYRLNGQVEKAKSVLKFINVPSFQVPNMALSENTLKPIVSGGTTNNESFEVLFLDQY